MRLRAAQDESKCVEKENLECDSVLLRCMVNVSDEDKLA